MEDLVMQAMDGTIIVMRDVIGYDIIDGDIVVLRYANGTENYMTNYKILGIMYSNFANAQKGE